VLRLLDKGAEFYELEEIGMADDVYDLFTRRLIRYSHGIIFVTGPTGSGKTTTLYAALSRINSSEKNIITIEDPIEYQLEGISQIQVNTKKNVTFANGLRSVLRQDPDILMVGEVRDYETASMAIQSALTGHLVFSTIHTNDAPSAITRLLDMKVEPYLVASSLIAAMGQRLIRKICSSCREAYEPEDRILKDIGLRREELKDGLAFRVRGCPQCRQTGYRGRTGIFELFVLTPHAKQQIMNRDNASQIKTDAVGTDQHMRTLHRDGLDKIIAGVTSIEEVMAHTQLETI
jgi:type II secretory ATPase GspE/PulE/Tfp pilus assembly ATPase PilB-like protein